MEQAASLLQRVFAQGRINQDAVPRMPAHQFHGAQLDGQYRTGPAAHFLHLRHLVAAEAGLLHQLAKWHDHRAVRARRPAIRIHQVPVDALVVFRAGAAAVTDFRDGLILAFGLVLTGSHEAARQAAQVVGTLAQLGHQPLCLFTPLTGDSHAVFGFRRCH